MHRRRLLGILTATILLAPAATLLPGVAFAAGPTGTAVEGGDTVTVAESGDGEATGLAVGGSDVTGTSGDGSDHLASTSDVGVSTDTAEVTVAGTKVDGDRSSADTLAVGVGGDDGVGVTALSSERDRDSASTTGVAVTSGGQYVEVLTSEADAGSGRTAVLDLDGTEVGTNEQNGDRLCTREASLLVEARLFCAAGGEDGGEAVIVDGLTVEQLSRMTGLSIDVLRANGVGDAGAVATPELPDATPPSLTQSAPDAPGRAAGAPAGPGVPLAAPVPGGGLPVAGATVLVLLLVALALVAAGSAIVRRSALRTSALSTTSSGHALGALGFGVPRGN